MAKMMRAIADKAVRAGLIAAVALGVVGASFGASAPAQATAAPVNPYPYGSATYWAWQNRPDLPANLGVSAGWGDSARTQGWPVSSYPRRADVAVIAPGTQGADASTGQLAVVEQVLQDGNFVASEMRDADCPTATAAACGRVNKRVYVVSAGTIFIHYKVDTRTTWGFASGQSGWTGADLLGGNYGGPGWFFPISGDDPNLVSPRLDISLDYSYNAVEVDMVTGIPVSDPTVQVWFATEAEPTFAAQRSAQVRGANDGQLHTYRFYFGNNPSWKGRLTGLRLDPAGSGAAGKAGVRIDRVRLVQIESEEAQTFTTLGSEPIKTVNGGRSR